MKAVQFVEHPLIIIDPPPLIRAERKEVKRLRVDRNEQSEINEILLLLLKWSVLLLLQEEPRRQKAGRCLMWSQSASQWTRSMNRTDERANQNISFSNCNNKITREGPSSSITEMSLHLLNGICGTLKNGSD